MTNRHSIRRHVASAAAALIVSTFCITAAASPVAVQANAPVATQTVSA